MKIAVRKPLWGRCCQLLQASRLCPSVHSGLDQGTLSDIDDLVVVRTLR